jgi:hypothetical protein
LFLSKVINTEAISDNVLKRVLLTATADEPPAAEQALPATAETPPTDPREQKEAMIVTLRRQMSDYRHLSRNILTEEEPQVRRTSP